MNKGISSQPDATKFRSIFSIIIVLICIGAYLTYVEQLSKKVEQVAQERVVADMEYSISMMFYDYVVKGKKADLKFFDHENPFITVAIFRILPDNYWGAVSNLPLEPRSGWYFDKKSKQAVYVDSDNMRFTYSMIYQIGKDGMGQLLLQ